jgi:hypothetical protein
VASHSARARSAARSPGTGFEEAFEHLAKDVRWTIVGYMVPEGSDAVIQTCRDSLDGTTTGDRCVVAAQSDVVGVDTVARYTGQDGVTAVASCDIYEFTGTKIAAITSHAVEVDPDCAGAPRPSRGAA